MVAMANAFGIISSLLGLYLSYYLGIAPGAAVVLVATGFFLLSLPFRR
jgi:manganese/iron transport system permease protein